MMQLASSSASRPSAGESGSGQRAEPEMPPYSSVRSARVQNCLILLRSFVFALSSRFTMPDDSLGVHSHVTPRTEPQIPLETQGAPVLRPPLQTNSPAQAELAPPRFL